LRLTAGGRYSADSRKGEGLTAFGQPYSADEDYDNFDWKIGLEADVGDNSMLYGTIQTGYQPGTYNLFPGNDPPSRTSCAQRP
jgi:iron complex outermembrane receptor protein